MRSRSTVLGALLLASTVVGLSACGGGKQHKESEPSGPDRSHFVAITARGVAAVVQRHLGDQVKAYAVLSDESEGELAQRTVEVTLRGEDPRDTFTVSVYPENGSQGQVAKGKCEDAGDQDDAAADVSCTPASGGGNVTITHLPFGLSGGKDGSYLTASGTGPEEREATAEYDGFTRKVPVSDKELTALLGDPDLGWHTDPKVNEAGASLTVSSAD